MTDTLVLTLSKVREALDDLVSGYNSAPIGQYYTNQELTDWINDAQADIADKAECNWATDAIPYIANTATYTLPANLIRINRATYVPTSSTTQTYPLQYRMLNDMDQVWGWNQTTTSSYPYFYTLWGTPPNLQIQTFPVSAQSGSLNIFYYRQSVDCVNNTDILDVPTGYEKTVQYYVEYCAMRKAGNPAWQDAMSLYQDQLQTLIDRSRAWTDQAGSFTTGGAWLPTWLTGAGDF